MATSYFNETGPIYMTELVQAKQFVRFVRDHVVVMETKSVDGHPEQETAWFNWQAFCTAVAAFQAMELSTERALTTIIPSYQNIDQMEILSVSTPITTENDIPDVSMKAVLDELVSRFASTFHNTFVPLATDPADTGRSGKSYFLDTLRKNLYHAFTHHLKAGDTSERCLSFHPRIRLDRNAHPRSAWEYRLLFVHSAVKSKTVRALVMTVMLEGRFEERHGGGNGEEAWYDVSLESRGPFSGALRAMEFIVGEQFRCP